MYCVIEVVCHILVGATNHAMSQGPEEESKVFCCEGAER